MNSTWPYLGFLALVAILRLVELMISKRNWKSVKQGAEMVREKTFLVMVIMHASLFVVIPLELFFRQPAFGGWLSYAAIAAFIFAQGVRIWTLRTMGKSWNVRVVHGPQVRIVSDGPFRFVRHPNYAVVILELAALPLIHNLVWSALYLTLANALVLRFRIRNEETVLAQNPDWQAQMAHKPRFIPGLF
jgi:methyltransferase